MTVDGVSKIYRLYARPIDRLWEAVTRRPHHRAHRALDDVSFEASRGEGVRHHRRERRGQEHAAQDSGRRDHRERGRASGAIGAAASILELGGGFHLELTGRQNIVLSAALLGLPERGYAPARRRSSTSWSWATPSTIRSAATRRGWRCGLRSASPSRCSLDADRGRSARSAMATPAQMHAADPGLPARGRHAAADLSRDGPRLGLLHARALASRWPRRRARPGGVRDS